MLAKDLRNRLARLTLAARETAEKAARAALENLAVHEKDYRGHMTVEQRRLRNRLRARGRALGDVLDSVKGTQTLDHLVADVAYEHWHRLLFTRFLTENHLLITDVANGSVPVTLEDCEELAPELGARDGFDLACRFASQILPGVFRTEDPVLELTFALNDQVGLRKLLDSLEQDVFTADDSLGWTYQYWQEKKKDDVNKAGGKIGPDELPAVTQLFTEDYMVEFLLHNTLGAWWAGKRGPIQAADEVAARRAVSLPAKNSLTAVTWDYLRFIQDEDTLAWKSAAGTFDGWPRTAREIRFFDPCMGSGHFIVFALPILARLRMEEENLNAADAVHVVLRENLYGLELDPRCTQLAAFNLALTAWKLSGYQPLPPLHLACCGLAPSAQKSDWLKLAGENDKLLRGMERLYTLFEQAPVLGSLIDPSQDAGDLIEAGFKELEPLFDQAMAAEAKASSNPQSFELAVTAQGITKAAEILAGKFTLVATNVPYLGRGKQDEKLKEHLETHYHLGKADLATAFVLRCLEFCAKGGSTALVTPQNWLFLTTYSKLRQMLLEKRSWNAVVRLGPGAFETISGHVVNVTLPMFSATAPVDGHTMVGIDVSAAKEPEEKAALLRGEKPAEILLVKQKEQLKNPDARVQFATTDAKATLAACADSYQGIGTSDNAQFLLCYWELGAVSPDYRYVQVAPERTALVGGATQILHWESGSGRYYEHAMRLKSAGRLGGWKSGGEAWGKDGVAVSVTGDPAFSRYLGSMFDTTMAAVIPKSPAFLTAIETFIRSDGYIGLVRTADQALSLTEHSFLKVPFDLAHWQKVAVEKYPNGLPEPESDDPTQWLFHGRPEHSTALLQVAVARLLGYRWPAELDEKIRLSQRARELVKRCGELLPFSDEDGIVCLPPINREQPAAGRLRNLLTAALSSFDERAIIAATGSNKTTLEDWLLEDYFEQHFKLFHHRPFVWHIWDGRKDGFHALVNYHRLDHATLQKLTYSYLGDWIRRQTEDSKADKPGSAERLGAALTLQTQLAKILEGETPYDIFVRWKPLKDQPLGWHPDLNDGVRLNIRPFLFAMDVGKKGAGLLRAKPNVKWDKDRGKEPKREKAEYPWFWCEDEPDTDSVGGREFTGHRWNNVHLTLSRKKQARGTA